MLERRLPVGVVLIACVALVSWACTGNGGKIIAADVPEDLLLADGQEDGDIRFAPPDVLPEVEDTGLDFGSHPDADALADSVPAEVTEVVSEVFSDVWVPVNCASHDDCEGLGMCVEVTPGSGQTLCAPFCIQECPGDWECKSVYVDGPDPVSLCFPPTKTICMVCTTDAQCIYLGALCIKGSGALGYCGKYCHPEESPECPEGFECGLAVSPGGQPLGHQCMPPADQCCVAGNLKDCDDGNPCTSDYCDGSLGCMHENIDGSCEGPEPCADYKCINGACIGFPVTEDLIIDGIDEDCDGSTDEDWALGARLPLGMFLSAPPITVSGGMTIFGTVCAPPFVGASVGGDFRVAPVTIKVKEPGDE